MEDHKRTTLGFLTSVTDGIKVTGESCTTAEAPIGYPTQGAIAGAYVVSRGLVSFGFDIKSNAVDVARTGIAVGVIDASVPLTASGGGAAIGLHVGRGKMIMSINGQKMRSGGKSLSRDTPRRLPVDDNGRISVMIILNMDTRRMGIAINENRPLDLGYLVPASVRPWVWFGGPGVGSVNLAEFSFLPPPETRTLGLRADAQHKKVNKTAEMRGPSSEATGPTAPAPAVAISSVPEHAVPTEVDLSDEMPLKPVAPKPKPPFALDVTTLESARAASAVAKSLKLKSLEAGDDPTPSSRTTSRSNTESNTSDPVDWTARATAWLLPMQQALFRGGQPENAEDIKQVL